LNDDKADDGDANKCGNHLEDADDNVLPGKHTGEFPCKSTEKTRLRVLIHKFRDVFSSDGIKRIF
jgi:hypothetical protein